MFAEIRCSNIPPPLFGQPHLNILNGAHKEHFFQTQKRAILELANKSCTAGKICGRLKMQRKKWPMQQPLLILTCKKGIMFHFEVGPLRILLYNNGQCSGPPGKSIYPASRLQVADALLCRNVHQQPVVQQKYGCYFVVLQFKEFDQQH